MTVEQMERLIEFCMGKIPDEDLLTLQDMCEKGVPAKELAADSAIRRREILALDCQMRGHKVVRKRVLHDIAQDRDAILAMHPNMFRLSDGSGVGAVPTGMSVVNKRPSRPMTATEKAEAKKVFPRMFEGD